MYVLHVLALGSPLWPRVYLLFFLNFFSSKFLSFWVRVRLGIGSGLGLGLGLSLGLLLDLKVPKESDPKKISASCYLVSGLVTKQVIPKKIVLPVLASKMKPKQASLW